MTAMDAHDASDADSVSVMVSGDLDIGSAGRLVKRGLSVLDDANTTIVIDLGGLTFMDCAGIGALIRLRNAAVAQDKQIELRQVPVQVQTLLNIAGLADVFVVLPKGPP
jgi:anti-sigma B factor antagonist